MRHRGYGCLGAFAILLAGCSSYSNYFEASADREVQAILNSKEYQATGEWREKARHPEPEKAEEAPVDKEARVLNLRDALRTATRYNRDFKTQTESVYLSALAASLQRRNFGPIVSNTLSYVYTNGPKENAAGESAASIGVSQIVPTGGTASLSTTATIDNPHEGGGSSTLTHEYSASFEQPLLKGFGYEVSHERLVQAERDVVYALREFELFRQDFTIDVLTKYYAIVNQKQVVENSRRTLEQFRFLRRRSEALFEVGKVRAVDKFRAAQEEMTQSNNQLVEQETLEALLDDFKIFLGLPTGAKIDVAGMRPEVKPAEINLKSALAAALYNRLDLKTTSERLEDAERKVRNARNGLLPDLDLTAAVTLEGSKTRGDPLIYDAGSHSLGIELSLPLDKVADRNAYRSALIEKHRRERAHSLAADRVKQQVLRTYRRLRRTANSVRIQTANVEMAERRVRNAELRFEAGELGNRDVVEAQSAKLRAENALIRAILDYDIARLQLKRDIGILFLDSDGVWQE